MGIVARAVPGGAPEPGKRSPAAIIRQVPYTRAMPPPRYELEYRVRFDEAGADGVLRSSGYLRYAQDLAWQHVETAGFGQDWYRARHLLWLVRGVDLEVRAPVRYGTALVATTQLIGRRKVGARRRSTFRTSAGASVAEALIDWVLIDEDGRPSRIPPGFADHFSDGTSYAPARLTVGPVPATAAVEHFAVRWTDVDPMAHVNNAVYVDYFDASLAAAGLIGDAGPFPRRYQVEFIRPAQPGADLVARCWQDEAGAAYRLEDAGGCELFRARFSAASPDSAGD